jgi:hypothetical protein
MAGKGYLFEDAIIAPENSLARVATHQGKIFGEKKSRTGMARDEIPSLRWVREGQTLSANER